MPRGIYPRTPEGRANIAATRRGTTLSEETKAKVGAAARRNATDPKWKRKVSQGTRVGQAKMTSEERKTWNANQSLARIGTHLTEATKEKLAKVGPHSWRGGKTADLFASILGLVGFVREYHFSYEGPLVSTGIGLRRPRYQMDFAHVKNKINIELDGPRHKGTLEHDTKRDAILRDHGWKVIRIQHE